MAHGTHAPGQRAQEPGANAAVQAASAELHRVTLTLARCPEHPDGSAGRGYDFVAPLGPDGRLDAALWRETCDQCRVRRFWTGEPDRHGRLVHRAGGEGGATWLIDYDDRTTDDDEPGYRLGTHAFVVGEYVSIRDTGSGDFCTFMVAYVSAPMPDREP
ncbi:hypothetical protein SAMN04487843_13615 [Methylobacterium sp. ap11]|uniref:hypothetical protein n=1 Tax=Methylobacterium sp. ap11 TaxID=1761799 RepID=UPI0008B856D5|nr:hypothetical protein [Methylobacterium sp. ap11]SEP50319.1 hypothetical protein SAMN04487843_13615 [Methylobacterium sp. ap11]